ncbi:MAG: anion transporter [Candidatus Eisenbacteria bacterium]|nr:anion transporter [Candidatus Eisenbacteria bacterium]
MPDRAHIAAVIFALTYVVLGFGALRPLRIDRAGATLVGATAMVAFGVLTPQQAVAAVDFHTLALLFGMMIVVANLRLAGFFGWLAGRSLRWAHAPGTLLALVVALSGVLSALFVNDTVCVLLTPVVLETALALGLSPVPLLLAVAMGANVGSVATIVGNPQNMLVASFSGIRYGRFAAALAPVALVGLALTVVLLRLAFRRELAGRSGAGPPVPPGRPLHRGLLVKSLVVTAFLVAALAIGVPPGLAALGAASALLVTRRVKPAKVYAQVDWALLTMFAGLFVVVEGVERAGLAARWLALVDPQQRESLPVFVAVTAVISNLVSNVPAVLVLKGWAARFAEPSHAWLALAMASTLAGNLTLVGSVANLIVVEQARRHARVGFWTYARVGIPLTLLTLALGTLWLLR